MLLPRARPRLACRVCGLLGDRLAAGPVFPTTVRRDKPSERVICMHSRQRYTRRMDEIIFVVEEAPEGGYTAKALGASIFTEAESLDELHANVRDAVQCHFERDKAPG
jgi:hypothetical protein